MMPAVFRSWLIGGAVIFALVFRFDLLIWSRIEHRINRVFVRGDKWASQSRSDRYLVKLACAVATIGVIDAIVAGMVAGGLERLGSVVAAGGLILVTIGVHVRRQNRDS